MPLNITYNNPRTPEDKTAVSLTGSNQIGVGSCRGSGSGGICPESPFERTTVATVPISVLTNMSCEGNVTIYSNYDVFDRGYAIERGLPTYLNFINTPENFKTFNGDYRSGDTTYLGQKLGGKTVYGVYVKGRTKFTVTEIEAYSSASTVEQIIGPLTSVLDSTGQWYVKALITVTLADYTGNPDQYVQSQNKYDRTDNPRIVVKIKSENPLSTFIAVGDMNTYMDSQAMSNITTLTSGIESLTSWLNLEYIGSRFMSWLTYSNHTIRKPSINRNIPTTSCSGIVRAVNNNNEIFVRTYLDGLEKYEWVVIDQGVKLRPDSGVFVVYPLLDLQAWDVTFVYRPIGQLTYVDGALPDIKIDRVDTLQNSGTPIFDEERLFVVLLSHDPQFKQDLDYVPNQIDSKVRINSW